MRTLYTARQIHQNKMIYWVESYKVILKYMHDYEHILKPISTGSASDKRYFIAKENIEKFIKMFENNELK